LFLPADRSIVVMTNVKFVAHILPYVDKLTPALSSVVVIDTRALVGLT